ncbi:MULTISPECIES: hypothetical protein [unclassified Curtobacterium]|uniref:hypothetical protein n=1 Tax=unclassified Curtobacterium TaxID=257496 RepID=UPI00082440D2|nr:MULTISPECIES: hypothetical protein [unclassified Curtobacterium]WIB00404.1 hypothetical protein QOL15_01560 [Curtobacterium sp. MCBA15_012]
MTGTTAALELEHGLLQRVLDENLEIEPSRLRRISDVLGAGADHGDDRDRERFLHERFLEVRRVLREQADQAVVDRFASPPSGAGAATDVPYGYERSAPSTSLDAKLLDGETAFVGWTVSGVVCSSGMAALGLALHVATYDFRAESGRLPSVAVLGDYFETAMLVELLSTSFASWTHCTSLDELVEAKADVVVIEPVRYNWGLDAVDFEALTREWTAGRGPRTIVVDSSLTPSAWPKRQFLAAMAESAAATVIEARSALKLDQLGLELANAGAVVVHRNDAVRLAPTDPQMLVNARAVLGAALPARSAIALENSFFLDSAWRRTHVALVTENNASFARELARGPGLFSAVAHPSTASTSAGRRTGAVKVAPFTVLRLEEDDVEDYRLLLGVIRTEITRRGIDLQFGASFGFRGHRHETIIPAKRDLRCLLKVAMGARRGPAMNDVIALFRELHELRTMDVVRRAFPGARPVELAL